MNISIRDLEFFMKVYECRSINLAADQLFITPQGLSSIIGRMEKELDCSLFTKDRGGSVPTEYGIHFYDCARIMLQEFYGAKSDIDRMKRRDQGIIRIGYAYGALYNFGGDFALGFERDHPDYRIEYNELTDAMVEDMVASGDLDVGFCAEPDHARFNTEYLASYEILYVVHPGSRFYDSNKVSVSEITEEPLSLREANFATTRIIKREFEKCGRSPQIILSTGGIMRSLKFAAEGSANTIIINTVAAQVYKDTLRFISFDEKLEWPLYMITSRRVKPSRAMEAYMEYARSRDWSLSE